VAHYLQGTLSSMSEKGIDLKDISDLDEMLQETTDKYEWIREISITNQVVAGKNQQSFDVSGGEENLMMTIEVSAAYLSQQVINMMLSYLAVIFLAVIIMVEALPLSEISKFLTSPNFGKRCSEQFAALAKSLRYVSFLSNTFTYICLSFSALLIKDWNQDFFGMPAGIAAALSISLCTLADAGGMLCMPLLSLPMNTLILGTSALLIVSNFACFFTHSVGVILLMRFLSGLSCAGHKQIMNTIIAQGYDTGEERTANLAANNYGIIGGILCGLGMGSVIADAFGYAATFLAAGFGGILYLLSVWYLLPWRMFDPRKEGGEGAVERIRSVLKMLLDPNLWRTIVVVVAPQYMLLMVIIVFIPGRIQSAGMPGVVLTYANLLNGVFGLYLGGYVSAFLSKRLSMVKSMALVFCVCAVSLLLMDLPVFPVAMVLLGAVVMGLADGVGTPLATELFLGNRTVMMELDEADGLMLYGVFGNIIMTVAPVLLEMCERSFTWTLCLSSFLVLVSGLLMGGSRSRKKKKA
jgi:predicted MFS family arabinose efflux permease